MELKVVPYKLRKLSVSEWNFFLTMSPFGQQGGCQVVRNKLRTDTGPKLQIIYVGRGRLWPRFAQNWNAGFAPCAFRAMLCKTQQTVIIQFASPLRRLVRVLHEADGEVTTNVAQSSVIQRKDPTSQSEIR
jgi:hypothetical protein